MNTEGGAEAEAERSGVRNAGATPALRTPEDQDEVEAEAKARDRAADEAEAKAEDEAEAQDEAGAQDEAEDEAEAPDQAEEEAEAGTPGEELVAAASAPRRIGRSRAAGPWLRVRSALTLLIVVAFTGVVLAVAVGTALTLAARALRKAVG